MEAYTAPSLHTGRQVRSYSLDVLIALLPLGVYAFVQYGLYPVMILALSIAAAILCEALTCWILRRRLTLEDGTAAVTGAIVAMLMSPIAPLWVPVIASAFAILIVKMPFGGSGRTVFNPAAAGVALVTVCFPTLVFTYPNPDQGIRYWWDASSAFTQTSIAATLKNGGASFEQPFSILFGSVPGAIGATAMLVLLAGAVYLIFRRTISPATLCSYLITCAVIAWLFPRAQGSTLNGILLELGSGYLLFGGIFLLGDPTTTPHHTSGRVIFGVLSAVLVMLLRHVGRYEEGLCFAVLLMNTLTPLIDRWSWIGIRAIEKRCLHHE